VILICLARINIKKKTLVVVMLVATLGTAWSQTSPGPNSSHSDSVSSAAPRSTDQSLKQQVVAPPNQAPDKLFDLPPLKYSQASLIGGVLESVDRLRGRFVLRPFGQGKLTIAFDPRTEFVRGAEVVGIRDMHPSDRVYVETVLDGSAVFAKTVHLPRDSTLGTAIGQIIAYDAARGSFRIRDQLSSKPVKFLITSQTIVAGAGVGPGALVQVSFRPGNNTVLAQKIEVLAAPGALFTFSGRVTFLDLAAHQLVVANASDDNRYEIQFNPAVLAVDAKAHLQEGANVTIAARFNGQAYVAESVTVLSHPTE
jgi:hypothetical protein